MEMGCKLGIAALCLAAVCAGQSREPVLVELFTSEGCSSCPPADRLLEKLDPKVIVLSEHVDYWDRQGWKDPFSSHQFTARQQAYGRVLGVDGVYTPQMIVDGETEFVGNDASKAVRAIDNAGRRKKAEMSISRSEAGLLVAVHAPPASADLYLAVADDSADSDVAKGENAGRRLHHVAVLRSIQKLGSVKRGADFSRAVELPHAPAGQRLVVFLQESGPGRIIGAAMLLP